MAQESRVVEIRKKLAELKSRCLSWQHYHLNGCTDDKITKKVLAAEERIASVEMLFDIAHGEAVLKLAEELVAEINQLLYDLLVPEPD